MAARAAEHPVPCPLADCDEVVEVPVRQVAGRWQRPGTKEGVTYLDLEPLRKHLEAAHGIVSRQARGR